MNYFIFDGESSLDYGVYIGGQNTFNAPQRDVAKVAIPGRNGDIVQDNGRFLNVQVPYNIVVMDSFRDKTDAIKAWLLSKKGYCKLVDTYHPGTYRMAMVAGGIDFETAAYNLTGKTQVIFDCKPERFLDSGDDVFEIGVWGQTETASGDIVTFNGDEDEAFKRIEAAINSTQDLNGYEYPWPAGGGPEGAPESNICPIGGRTEASVIRSGNNLIPQNRRTIVNTGITYTENSDGSVTINGTASSLSAMNLFLYSNANNLVPGQTYHMRLIGANSDIQMQAYANNTYIANAYDTDKTFTIPTDSKNNFVRLRITSGASFDNLTVFPMVSLVPITSYEARYGKVYNVTWQSEAGEVYAGTVDLISGTLSVTGVGKVFDGTESWSKNGTDPAKVFFRYVDSRGPCPEGGNRASSHFKNANVFSSTTETGYSAYTSSEQTNTYVQFRPGLGITELADWKAWLAEQYAAETPLECWWTISEPIVYQLAGQQIDTLLGTNNVWADSGSVEVEWSIDPNIMHNPTRFTSRPKMRVKGNGSGTVTIEGGTIIVTNLNEYVDIDSELMNCYKGAANKNADVALPNHEYPEFHPGANRIEFGGGITAVEVQGRWWTI